MRSSCFLLFTFLISGCASSLRYTTDYPMTKETLLTRDGMLRGTVPQGWFLSSEDTLAPTLLGWLIKDDYSATLIIQELRLDLLSAKQVEKNGLKLLAELSLAFKTDENPHYGLNEKPTTFSLNGYNYCSYEITSNGDYQRVVVFSAKGRFYECIARTLQLQNLHPDTIQLFSAQQSFLSSLTF